jgi:hypothetical protein
MPSTNIARLTGACALGAALLYAVSIPVGSIAQAPGADASGPEVWSFMAEHRTGILVAIVLNGVAWCALMPLAFLGLRELFGRQGGMAARVAAAFALLVAALIGVLLGFVAVSAYAAPQIRPDVSRLLSQAYYVLSSLSAWPTVPCSIALAVAARRTRILPRGVVGLALASAALEAVSGVSLARSGALSPSGIALLAPAAFAAVMAVAGVGLLRRSTVAENAHAAPAL